MAINNRSNWLRSVGISKLLIKFIYLEIILLIILVLLGVLLQLKLPIIEQQFPGPKILLEYFVYLIVKLVVGVLGLVWLYRLHVDLNRIYSYYPIEPGQVLALCLIPIYNIFGIWRIYSTFAEYLNKEESRGLKTRLLILYIGYVFQRGFSKAYQNNYSGDYAFYFLIIGSLVSLCLCIVFMQMIKMMRGVVIAKFREDFYPNIEKS
ncbi:MULTISPECIES: hypothetical protein [unclassified Moorena]|uniref:hypothetical protein n=1 Tax=unclassified Moorena TaxID=2683338 RepID=UPI0013C618AA|nr:MULTISPECIES: hypothetical protein [unclassified Moorena]NEO23332.1 hypothetical protein [Moorena sp. SIO4A5]NEQ59490.1 hypothetical protein [Moorena sp. SIO4A1]